MPPTNDKIPTNDKGHKECITREEIERIARAQIRSEMELIKVMKRPWWRDDFFFHLGVLWGGVYLFSKAKALKR
jgi:hypothetical protein